MNSQNIPARRFSPWVFPLLALLAAWCVWLVKNWNSRDALVLYCAHDLVFAQEVIDDFTRQTGIPVRVVGDTEATKSLGLVERIIREQDHPVCDLFWNNQVLGTVRLKELGLLQPYRGPGFERIPPPFKDAEAHWTGFSGRFRVWIINHQSMTATPDAVAAKLAGQSLSNVAIAVPLYGTTLSHYSLLWQLQGSSQVKQWHASLESRQARFVPGNATVKNLVATGACDLGMTDTDDFFAALDDGRPVTMLPILVEGKAICIPNSVALIKGSKRQELAQMLVEYLLSAEVELTLANSASRQVPLGPVKTEQLPQDVQELAKLVPSSHDCQHLAQAQDDCLNWLKTVYVPN